MTTDKEVHHYIVHTSRTWTAKTKEDAHRKARTFAEKNPGQRFSVVSCYTTGYRKGKKTWPKRETELSR